MEGVKRPDIVVLPEGSVVPPTNSISPAPNCFTHEVFDRQPYFFSLESDSGSPNGYFESGTKINLLVYDGGESCRVVDGRGVYAATPYSGLRKLEG